MAPTYGFGTDYAAVMNDPFWQYYCKNNLSVNFKGTAQQEQEYMKALQEYAALTQQPAGAQKTANSQVPDYKEIEPESSHAGLWITGMIGAGTLFYAMKRGKWNPIKGMKAIYTDITKAGKKAINSQSKISELTAIRNADGSYSYFVPGKTKKYAESEVENISQQCGISLNALRRFKEGTTKLEGGRFNFGGKIIEFKDGKIVKIEENGLDKTAEYIGENLKLEGERQMFLTNVKDIVADPRKLGKTWKENLEEAVFRREVGDNVATVKYQKNKGRTITELTTLEPLSKDSDAVKSWLQNHKNQKDVFTNSDFLEKGIIPEGAKVEFAEIPYKGKICRFEKGEFKGIRDESGYHKKGSEKCDAFRLDEESNLNDLYSKFLKNELPTGVNKAEIKVRIAA